MPFFPFANCCYPRTADKLKQWYKTLAAEQLAIIFDTGGAFYKFTQSLTTTHTFQPPKWTSVP